MTTSRVALGSASTLAAAALLLGAGPFLFNHGWGTVGSTPWGTISSFSGNLSTSTPTDGDRSQLLRLAALKGSKATAEQADPAMTAAAQLSAPPPAPPAPSPAAQAPVSSEPQESLLSPGLTSDTTPPASSAVPDAPQTQVASAETAADEVSETVPLPPAAPARGSAALVNINTASLDALDHFPGAGHIGHAIVSHRPYRAIEDLVRKRVLRTSDFSRIQSRISVD